MNIHYESDSIAKFYSQNRVRWDQFYPSEQHIFEKIFAEHGAIKKVLDVGCACGGLGRALHEQFEIDQYTGVDINSGSIELARAAQSNYPVPAHFECADIAARPDSLKNKEFDLVVSLSCADWNCDTHKIIKTCWDHTVDGGYFIFSFRLTNQKTLSSIEDGYQYVHFDEATKLTGSEEKAPYVVTNVLETMEMIQAFHPKPDRFLGYGYWGTPSSMAVIPYKTIVFSVLAVRKTQEDCKTMAELLLPLDLLVSYK
jgi:SAM-dependent methyltransferase